MASKSKLKCDPVSNRVSLDKHAVLESLEQLRHFEANWDGYGAAPPDHCILGAVEHVVESLPPNGTPTPKVVPMTRGRVQLEWHRGNRSLELEFESPTTIHYLKWDSDQGVETEDVISISLEMTEKTAAIQDLLNWFVAE